MRLIDADALPIKFDGHIVSVWKNDIDNAPTVDAEPVRHGHWEKTITWWIYCSVCGSEPPNECNCPTPYCPNCGAKMDEVKDGKDD